MSHRRQNTLKREISYSGIGIHTGEVVTMRFLPAEAGSGILFRRIDLPNLPEVPAAVEYVLDTARCTTIGIGSCRIHTVEHVLAALKAYQVDNLIIELNSFEPPVADGSSAPFAELIEEAEVLQLSSTIPVISLQRPIWHSEDEVHLVALPHHGFKVSYTLNYPQSKSLYAQYVALQITEESFKEQIAPARTFSMYNEISWLIDNGLIKGGSLDNAVVVKDDVILSKEGLRFPDEPARHKILDLIGDLSLIGYDLHVHIISIRSGHPSNYRFAKQIYQRITSEFTECKRKEKAATL